MHEYASHTIQYKLPGTKTQYFAVLLGELSVIAAPKGEILNNCLQRKLLRFCALSAHKTSIIIYNSSENSVFIVGGGAPT